MNLGKEIVFTIHNEIHTVKSNDISPETTLNSYLRDKVGLKGTKFFCLEGGCGTCLVVVKRTHPITNRVKCEVVNSCLVPIYACQGWSITTIENVGSSKTGYHEIQKNLTKFNGTQCGYCSPGMVMNMYALVCENDYLSANDIENSFGGNICRCTGYRSIMDAFKSMCIDAKSSTCKYPDIEDVVCSKTGQTCSRAVSDWDVIHGAEDMAICVNHNKANWYKVFSISSLMEIFDKIGEADYRLCAGNTGKGVFKIKNKPGTYIDITSILELCGHKFDGNLHLGANNTLTETMELFSKLSIDKPEFWYLEILKEHINVVANVPVRNIGTLAGNLMLKHQNNEFPSDIFIILETIGAQVVIIDKNGKSTTKFLLDFLKYPMDKRLLKNITLPAINKDKTIFESYKISPRYFNAHAYVNAAFLVEFENGDVIKRAVICYGGISKSFVHARATEKYIIGKKLFDDATIQEALKVLEDELKPDQVPTDANPVFRQQLAQNLFYKFILKNAPKDKLNPKHITGGPRLDRPLSSGSQEYESDKKKYPLTEPVVKMEALRQTSGEVQYVNDIPKLSNELQGAFVLAEVRPFSIIDNIDPSAALALKGVVGFISHKDVPGENSFSPPNLSPTREELFCSGKVLYNGQPIGVVLADSFETAVEAAELVKVTYKDGSGQPLFNIKQVLESPERSKRVEEAVNEKAKRRGGDVKEKIHGSFAIGGQYHFSMETQVTLCCQNDDGGFDIFSATQWMDHVQGAVANATKIAMNKINISVKRLGGAYGYKIVRPTLVATACAVACQKLNAPVRILLPMSTAMKMIGKRMPYHVDYECEVNDLGAIQYLSLKFFHDYGTSGKNEPVYMYTRDSLKSCYVTDTWEMSGYMVQTDMPGNCYCRAPGSCEGIATIEHIMDHIAMKIGKDPIDVRVANIPPDSKMVEFVKEILDWSDYHKRREEIERFNQNNRWKKKGLSIACMNYVIDIFGPFFAFVAIYAKDGTVTVSHGGVEVGQGINTKVAQVCAYILGVPLENVSIKATNNLTSANNTMTGGSLTSEACCYATMQACNILLDRLKPIREKNPNVSWQDLVQKAHLQNIQLSATSMYSMFDPNLASYGVNGCCVSEVEVDVLTGEKNILKVEIIEDVGSSMSPAIDVGQCEGAFVMGLGLWTLENLVYDQNGGLLTQNTWYYKVPGNKEIPNEFKIRFKKNTNNPKGVFNSKAVGEPPLCLSATIPLAIRQALASARYDADPKSYPWFDLDGPTTIETTLMNTLNDYKQYTL